MPFLTPNQQRQSTEGKYSNEKAKIFSCWSRGMLTLLLLELPPENDNLQTALN